MPVKRSLQLQDKENSPTKRHSPVRNYSPMTGTRLMSPAPKSAAGTSKAGGKKTNTPKTKKPLTDAERIVFLRTKVKRSLKDMMKYRHQLESLLPVEGSSELRSLLLMGPADLNTELRRHEDLSAKIASCVQRADTNKGHFQDHLHLDHLAVADVAVYKIYDLYGLKQTGSSSEFIKEILSR